MRRATDYLGRLVFFTKDTVPGSRDVSRDVWDVPRDASRYVVPEFRYVVPEFRYVGTHPGTLGRIQGRFGGRQLTW